MNAFLKSFSMNIVIFFLCCIFYPAICTFLCQLFFPTQSKGSLITANDHVIGSSIIGQIFNQPHYFYSRLTEMHEMCQSFSQDQSIKNPQTMSFIEKRKKLFESTNPIPSNLLSPSASGLDPHISVEAAYFQIPRIQRYHTLSEESLKKLIDEATERSFWGSPVVNVLRLNLLLNQHQAKL